MSIAKLDLYNPEWLELVFDSKNKDYGAYQLRRHYAATLVKWVLNKYKKFKSSYSRAYQWIKELKRSYPAMFYYWTVFKYV